MLVFRQSLLSPVRIHQHQHQHSFLDPISLFATYILKCPILIAFNLFSCFFLGYPTLTSLLQSVHKCALLHRHFCFFCQAFITHNKPEISTTFLLVTVYLKISPFISPFLLNILVIYIHSCSSSNFSQLMLIHTDLGYHYFNANIPCCIMQCNVDIKSSTSQSTI